VRTKLFSAAMVTTLALVAGCGTPAGLDGNLTDNWPAMPEAKIAIPLDRACYDVPGQNPGAVAKLPAPSDCSSAHTVETLHLGTFTGADAERTSPPPMTSASGRRAYEECASSAKSFLGDDWRAGRMDLLVNPPTGDQWEAGARWFRCDAVEFNNLDELNVVSRKASLQGALAGTRPIALACFTITVKAEQVDTMVPIDCGANHNGEFGGVYESPDGPYVSDEKQREAAQDAGCLGTLAGYAGIPNDSNFLFRTGYITSVFGKADWEMGNRGARCYLWTGKQVNHSLKGAGTGGLPIN
jgi:hypothetical protein